ncbi:PKD domain-containing protein [Kaistella jeonii]|uniref:PKD domain-containing protein n=1 Tax=Kaistella jeonii TaxID=266749 RepID=A0A0C1F0I0_9FLAO|nr:PKD domain-containing protein [Kaistella jeonii]KIA85478.1 PKD domain-containing protein [Kaistella jeonii]SFC41919.1 PKD domain-containing protein [Kaistella jeonii]VEI97339.1 PKD domain [Kaistella jeonii]
MNYIQKNRRNILLISAAVIILAGLLIWALQKKGYTSEDMVATVSPNSVNVGESVSFEDKTSFGKTRKWVFGDGSESTEQKGLHIYKKPGYYQVSLILDNEYTKTFPILVSSAVVALITDPSVRTSTVIDAPSQAMQLENVLFRAVSNDAKIYSWKFGETGNIDAKDKMVTYAFKNAGTYVVTLYTDADTEPIVHQIKILPSYPVENQQEIQPIAPTQGEVINKMNDDFRYHLQQIANGSNFNMHYYYLLRTYLCNKENVSVSSNGKNISFYYYCTGLQFDKNNLIQEVTTTVDPGQNCVTKVEVKQSKE